ncbi:hypothetical protein T02_9568 [Trichinella nativa]|uniref:Uncharacterized protein n=1 Tax=Trichinella nativa TaxID=6335 RepID=A0A0V1LDN1_9BILA|nr:hypothetical protein T02_9568 [Trichinella nativa]
MRHTFVRQKSVLKSAQSKINDSILRSTLKKIFMVLRCLRLAIREKVTKKYKFDTSLSKQFLLIFCLINCLLCPPYTHIYIYSVPYYRYYYPSYFIGCVFFNKMLKISTSSFRMFLFLRTTAQMTTAKQAVGRSMYCEFLSSDKFAPRHLGPNDAEQQQMLNAIGCRYKLNLDVMDAISKKDHVDSPFY